MSQALDLLNFICKAIALFRTIRGRSINQSSQSVGWPVRESRRGCSQSNIQQTLSCKVPETRSRPARHPDGGFLPRDVARESRKSDKLYRRLNVRRPSGNKSENLPTRSLSSASPPPDHPRIALAYLVSDPRSLDIKA